MESRRYRIISTKLIDISVATRDLLSKILQCIIGIISIDNVIIDCDQNKLSDR